MSTQPKDAKPRRMYGITPPPMEIPTEHKPVPAMQKLRRPLPIAIFAVYFLVQSVVFLLLAIVPWSDPDSAVATYLIANPALAFGMLPRMFRPIPSATSGPSGAFLQVLPFFFLALCILLAILAYKLWTLCPRWRWGTVFWSVWSLVKSVRFLVFYSIIRDAIGVPLPSMPAELKLFLLVSMAWNFLIAGYLSFYPGVRQAFEKDY